MGPWGGQAQGPACPLGGHSAMAWGHSVLAAPMDRNQPGAAGDLVRGPGAAGNRAEDVRAAPGRPRAPQLAIGRLSPFLAFQLAKRLFTSISFRRPSKRSMRRSSAGTARCDVHAATSAAHADGAPTTVTIVVSDVQATDEAQQCCAGRCAERGVYLSSLYMTTTVTYFANSSTYDAGGASDGVVWPLKFDRNGCRL